MDVELEDDAAEDIEDVGHIDWVAWGRGPAVAVDCVDSLGAFGVASAVDGGAASCAAGDDVDVAPNGSDDVVADTCAEVG